MGHARQGAQAMASPTTSLSSACSPSLGAPGIPQCWIKIIEKTSNIQADAKGKKSQAAKEPRGTTLNSCWVLVK